MNISRTQKYILPLIKHKNAQPDPKAIASRITKEMFEYAEQKFIEYMNGEEPPKPS